MSDAMTDMHDCRPSWQGKFIKEAESRGWTNVHWRGHRFWVRDSYCPDPDCGSWYKPGFYGYKDRGRTMSDLWSEEYQCMLFRIPFQDLVPKPTYADLLSDIGIVKLPHPA